MKPHIKKVNGEWDCNGQKANSPYNAYFMWQFKTTTKEEYKKFIDSLPKPKERISPIYNHIWSGQWKGA